MKMITEDYVSFEVAKLLKEKGFNEQCHSSWDYNPNKENTEVFIEYIANGITNNKELEQYNEPDSDWAVSAPTLQMAMKWLREVHNIHIEINPICVGDSNDDLEWHYGWAVKTTIFTDRWKRHNTEHISYEQACEAAIKYQLINGQNTNNYVSNNTKSQRKNNTDC